MAEFTKGDDFFNKIGPTSRSGTLLFGTISQNRHLPPTNFNAKYCSTNRITKKFDSIEPFNDKETWNRQKEKQMYGHHYNQWKSMHHSREREKKT